MALGWLWCFWFLVDIIPYFQFVVVPYGKWFYYATTVVRHMSHDVRMSIMYQTKSTKDDMWRRRYLVFFGISWNMEPTSKIIISTVRTYHNRNHGKCSSISNPASAHSTSCSISSEHRFVLPIALRNSETLNFHK